MSTHQVCVTGATGYLAGHLIQQLLERGYRVNGTVRSLSKSPKLAALYELANRFPGQLELFQADLLTAGSFRSAIRGCSHVFHTASPFHLNVAHPQRDLVEPAVKGVEHVLSDVAEVGGVERVILTSSVAAMYGDVIECKDGPIDEQRWNTTSSLTHQPYQYSKTLAERRAWELAEPADYQLVVVNPSLVLGPAIGQIPTSESFNLLRRLGSGELKTGAPPLGLGVVDVRDVAQAHMACGFSDNAQGRYLCSGEDTDFFSLAQRLKQHFPTYPLPKGRVPKWLIWLVGKTVDPSFTRYWVSRNLGHDFVSRSDKIQTELGVQFRPIEPGLVEMFQQLINQGVFE